MIRRYPVLDQNNNTVGWTEVFETAGYLAKLRDEFAAHALGFLLEHAWEPSIAAKKAYAYADAMLKEREKENG